MTLFYFMKSIYGKKLYIQMFFLFFLGFFLAGIQFLFTYHFGVIIDSITDGYQKTLWHFWIIVISLLFFIVGSALFSLYSGQVSTLFSYRLRRKIGEKLCYANYQEIEKQKDGELLTIIDKDIESIKEWLTTLMKVGSLPAQLGLIPLFIIWYNWKFAVCTLLLIPLAAVPELLIAKNLHIYHSAEKKEHAHVLSFFTMSIEQSFLIKLFHLEKTFQRKNQDILFAYKKAQAKRILREQFLQIYGHCNGHIDNILILLLGAYFILSGEMSLGLLTSIILFANLIGNGLNTLNEIPSQLQAAKASFIHIQTLLQLPNEYMDTNFISSAKSISPVSLSSVPIYQIRELDFFYHQKPILQNIELCIYKGEKIAIVGPSGCGKTTLFKLLSGLYTPKKNQIFFYGEDISNLPLNYLRKKITTATQETFLFHASYQDNIRVTDTEQPLNMVIDAAKHAQIDSFIQSFAHGYHTIINTMVSPISNGQMQRINLARSFLKDADVYLFDEPTSALDQNTTKQIFDYLFSDYTQKTILMILHDMQEICRFDKILVLEEGKIAGFGTHQQLLSECTLYQKLYREKSKK